MDEIIVRTQKITRDFGALRAVNALDIEVPRGAIFGFLGPNGSGKTTTIRLLLGLLTPTSGQAWVLGREVSQHPEEVRARCGALLEHTGLYERLTAADNLEFYGRIWHMPAAMIRDRSQELLERLGMWDRRGEVVGTWSRGMKQKLAVARAMFHKPDVLFLDEPTSGLDPVAAASLHDDLAQLAYSHQATVFLTTHNLAEAEKLCSQVAVINQGRLLAVGSPDELRARGGGQRAEFIGQGFNAGLLADLQSRPEVRRIEHLNGKLVLDLRDGTNTAPLVSLMVQSGVQLEEVHKVRASLEETFLSLVEEEK